MSDWISVEDRMPEIGTQVLVAYDLNLEFREFDDYESDYIFSVWRRGQDDTIAILKLNGVTHWQPLPPPPEQS